MPTSIQITRAAKMLYACMLVGGPDGLAKVEQEWPLYDEATKDRIVTFAAAILAYSNKE